MNKLKVLVVVDMQNDFVTGSLGSKNAEDIVEPILKSFDDYDRIIFTQDTHYDFNYHCTIEGKWLPVEHCIVGTEGHDLIEPFRKYIDGHQHDKKVLGVYEKSTFGSVRLGETLQRLKDKIESVTFVGVCTDICVISNALLVKAFIPDTPIRVSSKMTAASLEEMQKEALDVMNSCHIEIIDQVENEF